jgi:hypothetical protein
MKLFPRLPERFAHDVFVEQKSQSFDDLKGGVGHRFMVWPATGAARVSEDSLQAIRDDIFATARGLGYPSPLGSADQRALDIALARVLLDIDGLTLAEASFPDVWSFVALVLVPEIVWWRAAGSTNEERFVASDLTRHTLARLWWRARLFTTGTDPNAGWALWTDSAIGEAELDQIQTRRGGYGRSPVAFRALVRAYPVVIEMADQLGIERRTFWRQSFLRWILRLGVFINFSGIDEDQLFNDLVVLAEEVAARAAGGMASADDNGITTTDAEPSPGGFDDVPLASMVVVLAEAIRARGAVAFEELSSAFEGHSGITVPTARREILNGLAWQAQTLNYLSGGKSEDHHWRPGSVLPAEDRRWGTWTINAFGRHLFESEGSLSDDEAAAELFRGRVGATVRRVLRAARDCDGFSDST